MYIMVLKASTGTILWPVHLLELQVSLDESVIYAIYMCQRKFLEYEYGASLRYTNLSTFRIKSLTFPLNHFFS